MITCASKPKPDSTNRDSAEEQQPLLSSLCFSRRFLAQKSFGKLLKVLVLRKVAALYKNHILLVAMLPAHVECTLVLASILVYGSW